MNPRSDTKTIIVAMQYLSEDIESADGVANAAIAEAAQRLQELLQENEVILKNQLKTQLDLEWWKKTANTNINISLQLADEIEELRQTNQELEDYTDKLVTHIPYLPKDMEVLRQANLDFAEHVQDLEDKVNDSRAEYIHLLQYIKTLREDNERLTKQNESLLARASKNDRRTWL
jgi:chromosome segregation ATPase